MINNSTSKFKIMYTNGQKIGKILVELLDYAIPGRTLMDIEKIAMKKISNAGGHASFTTVEGYKWATCLCLNDAVVHGIPTNEIIKDGDLLTIDIGMLMGGYHTDTAWTKLVLSEKSQKNLKTSKILNDKQRFLNVGQKALWEAIDQAKIGNHVGHISQAIQKKIEEAGYSIVKILVGHGVGKKLHEEPQIPGFIRKSITSTPLLKENMTIAIEVIYAKGSGKIYCDPNDGWTMRTKDGSYSAVFEHTIIITKNGPMVLTKSCL